MAPEISVAELDYKALWAIAKARGAKAAESRYPENQPEKRRRHAHMVTLREYRSMTSPGPPPLLVPPCQCPWT